MTNISESVCPVCGNQTLEPGERTDVGFGMSMSVQVGPDYCFTCGYVEAGADPDDSSFEFYAKCWELQVDPSPPAVTFKRRPLVAAYQEWIDKNVPGTGYGLCFEMAVLLMRDFPSFTLVGGTYFCSNWGPREHYWCTDDEGFIVDPTAQQFPSGGRGLYAGSAITKDRHLWSRVEEILKKGTAL